jgi:hypothetical protein
VKLVEGLSVGSQEAQKPGYKIYPGRVDSSELDYVTVFVADEPDEASQVRERLVNSGLPFITRGEDETKFHYVEFLVREDKIEEAKAALSDILEKESQGAEIDLTTEGEIVRDEELKEAPSQPQLSPGQDYSLLILFIALVPLGLIIYLTNLRPMFKYLLLAFLAIIFILKLVSREKRI